MSLQHPGLPQQDKLQRADLRALKDVQGGPLQACPVCQQWSGLGTEPDAEPSARQIRRKAKAPRRHLSEEHKEKIRQAHAGRKRKPLDEEHKRRAPTALRACIPLLLLSMSTHDTAPCVAHAHQACIPSHEISSLMSRCLPAPCELMLWT